MEFFCWFFVPSGCCPRRKKSTLNLGLKKGAWILCIAEGKALLSSLASWACWACWRAGCGLAALLFLSLIFCFSLFLSSWSAATLYLYFSSSIPREASRSSLSTLFKIGM
jgi:hypothetical protein